ncbi:MAG: RNA-binding S4 domain-containing protein [Candidatus Izemoplasmatales bacterium]|jgi:S4 domain protein YaaA|nr:RNA-binding S4 domain-containing protein [Candidatus Izemoplasmatales bacterium]NLF48027.1 RNA-binding S4 domain-containing protein [Acholeplasmataceae bacterium]MDD4354401.1 RNA-binding S4 domain-containing protein [Candidatus Izemoplasmatales bacterium]MDD4987894.1 RNA-binding S4 domain-containing protein [Candidatus Izemoplasmatales bacterium]MDD5601909.1 RNA-binding S4 domain-containing protein [Candidatus Izemoplasmatales bacterium]
MKEIWITTPFITLGQALKYAGLLQSGGEIKLYLASNTITVNQTPENRRGRKLYPGDVIHINQQIALKIGIKS